MTVNFDIKDKVAVLTGAGGIICGTMAREFAKKGARVALLDLFVDKAQAIADEITRQGGQAIALQADVLDRQSLLQARQAVLDQLGPIDILVNGAGGNKPEATTGPDNPFFTMDLDAFKWVLDLNVTGAVLTTQVFGQAKSAVANFTQWMATHFNQNYSKNIRVNAIAPGFLLTDQNRYLLETEEGQPTARGEKVLAKTPMGRYGQPEEMAGAVIWLCSDAASFVNGAVIPIDGGFSAYWGV